MDCSYFANLGKKRSVLEVYLEVQRSYMSALFNVRANLGCDRAVELL